MAFYNPFRKLICPFCFEPFHPGECHIISQKPATFGTVLKAAPRPGPAKMVSRFWITEPTGKKYALELATRACSRCGNPLPSNFERADNYIIALVGGNNSGKSLYIAVLIDQLKKLQYVVGASILEENQAIEDRYKQDYYNPLFRAQTMLQANPRGRAYAPLVYTLDFSVNPNSPHTRPVNLIFYDVAGEDIAQTVAMVDYARFVLNAHAIIFLADPLTMPGIESRVLPMYRATNPAIRRSSEVLAWVVQQYEKFHGQGGRVSIPIAITVSKSDLLQYIKRQPPYAFFTSPAYLDPYGGGRPQRQDFEAVNSDVWELLSNYGDGALLQLWPKFENVHFFAVSATGWPADQAGRFPAIEPIRVLDPLLWVLSELDIITIK